MSLGRKLICGASFAAMMVAGGTALAQEADDDEKTLDRVVVTGSLIARDVTDQFDSANPLDNLGQDAFTDTGILTNAELARTLVYNTGSENQADALTQGQNVGTANINLRGLGVGSTLVLLNGKRQTVSGAVTNRGDTFVDINTLVPQIMINNIEIVKDGAAALYGSDAVAGVVNFKTRNDFEGAEFRANYQQTGRGDDHKTINLQGLFGTQGDDGSIVFGFSWFDVDELRTTERDFEYQTISSFGNPGSFLLTAPSPNFPDAALGAGVFNADPVCGDPSINPQGIPLPQANGGTLCLFDFGPNYSLVPESESFQGYVVADRNLTEDDVISFEFGYTAADFTGGYSTSFPNLAFPIISDTHPGNPWGVPVAWRGRVLGDNGLTPGDNRALGFFSDDVYRAVLSIDGDLFNTDWTYGVSATFSRDDREQAVPDQIGQRLDLALAGLGGPDCNVVSGTPGVGDCQYYNPFGTAIGASPGDPEYNDPALIEYLTARDPNRIRSDLTTYEAFVTGDIMELPAGPLSAAFGYQNRREVRDTDARNSQNAEDEIFLIGTPDANASRTVDAFFGELAIPLMDSDNLGTLDAQVAVRWEDYSSGQSSTDPKFALRWAPMDNLAIRGSWSSAFRAPTLFQLNNQQTALNATLDPFTGSLVFLGETARPNPDLDPEEADTINLGVSWEPIQNLVIDIDYYNVEYENLISTQIGQQLLIAESAALAGAGCDVADLVADVAACLAVRNPNIVRSELTGGPLRIFTERENAPSASTDGVDVTATYEFDTDNWGTFGVRNQTTFVNSFEIETAPGVVLEGAGARNANTPFANPIPDLRSNTSFSWANGPHTANAVVRYISEYDENDASGTVLDTVESWTLLDLQYGFYLEDFMGFGNGSQFTFGVNNVFDEDPPVVTGQTNELGYDTKTHDPRGRMFYVGFTQSFE